MIRLIHKKQAEGSITVFLSLILLLILSLVMTVIEGARVNTAKVFAERALTTAMDSVLAEFYRPLMEEYHLLGLDAGYGEGKTVQEEVMEERLKNYMSYTFSPNNELEYNNDRMELYDISIEDLTIMSRTGLMDYQGELFIHEAVEYMKYRELGNGVELLLDKMSLLEEPKRVSILYEEKSKVEEELVVIDEGILSLMNLLDGVATSKKGLKVDKDGILQTSDYFIKKINYGTPSKEQVGINNEHIFMALQDSYFDPTDHFEAMTSDIEKIQELLPKIEDCKYQIRRTDELLKDANIVLLELQEQLSQAKEGEGIKGIQSQIKGCQEYIHQLVEQRNFTQHLKSTYEEQKRVRIEEVRLLASELNYLVQKLKPLILSANTSIDKIIEASNKADPLIQQYEESLKRESEGLRDEIYEGLEEGLQELKRYQTSNEAGYNFPSMRGILEHNLSVLCTVENVITEGIQALSNQDYTKAKEHFLIADTALIDYQIEGLTIDYSTLVLRKEMDMDPVGIAEALIEDGLAGLVVDPDTISEAAITETMLPSALAAMAGYKEGTGFDFISFFEDMVIGEKNTGMGSLFGSFGDYSTADLLGKSVNRIAEHLLYQSYLQEHFNRFPMKSETDIDRKPSILDYEQEYLLMGASSDKDNLISIISTIIFLRTILNFTSVLGDKVKRSETKTIATALVGFTGLPVLVAITQTILMVLLSFVEALVDTCALLMGKEVPLLKKKINLTVLELPLLNRTFIEGRASNYTTESSGLALSYPDYLKVLLFFKNKKELAFRSMDIIQENLRIRYENSFKIQNCLFGFEAEAVFTIKPKFTTLSVLQDYIYPSFDTEHKVAAGYSY